MKKLLAVSVLILATGPFIFDWWEVWYSLCLVVAFGGGLFLAWYRDKGR
ncbi:MAG: hypothetical protein L0332_05165 [Chloroflexi bacterium]|nr:hypothetical protein [Chloroflexota bacterium]MCI0643804.1 hypothetical protein [Chloroflexota bacterium]MCI0726098.1 hypothetical protein [Chloroflexota bacterium]